MEIMDSLRVLVLGAPASYTGRSPHAFIISPSPRWNPQRFRVCACGIALADTNTQVRTGIRTAQTTRARQECPARPPVGHFMHLRAGLLPFGEVEPVKIHYLVPRRHEVANKRLRGIAAGIGFRDGPELGVRAEEEINGAA